MTRSGATDVYDNRQHIDLFENPGPYLFRGALPTRHYAGSYQGLGVTPTSVDPIVATLFACRYRMEGAAIVLIARKDDFGDCLNGPNFGQFHYELAVNLDCNPAKFEQQCIVQVSVDQSLAVLRELGFELPPRLIDFDALRQALGMSPRMLSEQIAAFAKRCQQTAE